MNKFTIKNIVFPFGILFILNSCINSDKKPQSNSTNEDNVDSSQSSPNDPIFHVTAGVLAGDTNFSREYIPKYALTSEFKSLNRDLNLLWDQSAKNRLTISEWASKELEDVNRFNGALFYPFSGADFLHANLFFPNSEEIIMIALEPKGSFVNISQLDNNMQLADYMFKFNKSLSDILRFSFFRTVSMNRDFRRQLDGNLSVFLYFFYKTGHRLLNIEPISIDNKGMLVVDSIITTSYSQGFRFYYQRNGEDKVRTLVYFSANIQDGPYTIGDKILLPGLNENKNLLLFLEKQKIHVTYLKSASYLLHDSYFSKIRNLILEKSQNILQDDSGIPINFFNTSQWHLKYYGKYDRPIKLFDFRFQLELQKAYEFDSANVGNLPFGIGYKYFPGTSNLQLAKRKI